MLRILFFLMFLAHGLLAQDYYVLYLKGKIQHLKSQKLLQVGDKIEQKDAVKFLSNDAKAVVISNKAGRFVLKPQTEQNQSELQSLVANVLFPDKNNIQLSARTALVNNMQLYFSERFCIIGNELNFKVDTTKYSVNPQRIFMFRYLNSQGDTLEKPIRTLGNKLILNKLDLYRHHPEFLEKDDNQIEIVYFDIESSEYEILASSKINFVNEDQLYKALKPFCEQLSRNGFQKTDILMKVEEFITEFYGKTDPDELIIWLDKKKLLQ